MNLDCHELIADYQKRSAPAAAKTKRTNSFGYEQGLDIERILGATDIYGELMFLSVIMSVIAIGHLSSSSQNQMAVDGQTRTGARRAR